MHVFFIAVIVSVWMEGFKYRKVNSDIAGTEYMMSTTVWYFYMIVFRRTSADVGRLHLEPECKVTWNGNTTAQRSLSSYDETAPGPSSPYSPSQVFPADAAVVTVSKDNTFSWISNWRSQCQHSICSTESWVEGLCSTSLFRPLQGLAQAQESFLIKNDKRINIMCLCPLLLSRFKLLEMASFGGYDDFHKADH